MKLRSNAARTPSKPDSTIPSTAIRPPCTTSAVFYEDQLPIAKSAADNACKDAPMPNADTPAVDRALLDEAVAFAHEAGVLTLRWFQTTDLVVDRKGDGTPVTDADRSAERLLRDRITA